MLALRMDDAEQNRPVHDVITDMELALRNGREAVEHFKELLDSLPATAGTLNDPRFSERRFSTGAQQSKGLPAEPDRHTPCAQLLGNAPRRVLTPDPDR